MFADQPTTKEVMDLLRRHVESMAESDRGVSDIIWSIVHDDFYTDVEKLYGGIAQMRHLDKIPDFKPIFHALSANDSMFMNTLDELTELRSIVRGILLASFNISRGMREPIKDMYDMVISVIGDDGANGLQVFTTNYDVVMEAYADASHFEIINGFKRSGYLIKTWDNNWDRRTNRPPLYLMKLHGSVRWYEDDEGSVVESGDVIQRDMKHDVMIYPTEGTKYYGKEPFATILRRFKKEVKDVDILLVIGFSYRDEEITNIIQDRVNDGMGLISVSPDAVADIRRAFGVDAVIVDDTDFNLRTGGRFLRIAGDGIILLDQKFESDAAPIMRYSLRVAYELARRQVRLAQGGQARNNEPLP